MGHRFGAPAGRRQGRRNVLSHSRRALRRLLTRQLWATCVSSLPSRLKERSLVGAPAPAACSLGFSCRPAVSGRRAPLSRCPRWLPPSSLTSLPFLRSALGPRARDCEAAGSRGHGDPTQPGCSCFPRLLISSMKSDCLRLIPGELWQGAEPELRPWRSATWPGGVHPDDHNRLLRDRAFLPADSSASE